MINETVLEQCMKYILEQIQFSRSEIVAQLMADIQLIQRNEPAVNCEPLKEEIENLSRKKRKAIDLMLDDLISKDDLKKQTEFYGSEIARLTEEIAESQNVGAAHQKQLDGIRSYIKQVNDTAEMDTNSTAIYGEMLKKVIVHEEGRTDFFLNCVPFGFRLIYTIHRYNRGHKLDVIVDRCEII